MQDFLKHIIKQAGDIAKPYFFCGVSYQTKADHKDMVTEVDIAVSNFLVGKIETAYPTHHIKSEELAEDINVGAEYEWIIDPIDGTRNFAIGVPMWAVMIAVMKNGQLYLGAVYHPLSDELFFAEKGGGAFLNGKKITVNNTDTLERAYGMMFRSSPFGAYGDYFEKYRTAIANFALQTNASMLNFGCAGMLCYLAKGSIDFAFGNAGLDWDMIPNFLICEEAGAVVTDSSGEPWKRGRQDYVIANPTLHSKVLEVLQST